MSAITYACVNEGFRKLIEAPPINSVTSSLAEQMQTVLSTVPPGEAQEREIDDNDYVYFYFSNGRHTVGAVCRKLPGQTRLTENTISEVRSFLRDALQLAPTDPKTILTGPRLQEMQQLLKERLEASTDAKITQINSAINRARQTMESNIESALERGTTLTRMQETSDQLQESADAMHKKTEDLNRHMFFNRIKTMCTIALGVAILIIVIVFLVCNPNLSACIDTSSSSDNVAAATTTTTTTTLPPTIHIG